ncbi:MAG: CapA family protein [Chloroflexota bacterium]
MSGQLTADAGKLSSMLMTNRRFFKILVILFITACSRPPAALIPELPSPSGRGVGGEGEEGVRVSSTIQPASPTAAPPLTPPMPIETDPPSLPSPTPSPWRVGAAQGVPAELVFSARQVANQQPTLFTWANEGPADVTLTLAAGAKVAEWVYAVAVPFATVTDDTTLAEVITAWQTGASPLGIRVVDRSTLALFSQLWGPPAAIEVADKTELAARLWSARPAWTLLPFHQLTPDLKVLRLDGLTPLEPTLDLAAYPLVATISAVGEPAAVSALLAAWPGPTTNRDTRLLTRVAMTGVTALSRATAYQMELQSVTTPGAAVAPLLTAADIAHVSNEVSFAPNCPYPSPIGDPIFCSRDPYFQLLTSLGVDVVELTGNHVNDWGAANLLHSLDLYDAAGMLHFGGGRDLADAERPALFVHNGNRIAFLGCNPVGPYAAWATAASPGARPCDYDAFFNQIAALRAEGYLVMATLQYWEIYDYAPTLQQQADFRAVAAAGATAVSGSQGHHAQGFDFYNGAFIHYGLGNLFFDQMDILGTRQSFMDSYVIYDGRVLSVDLFIGLIENYCCPRLLTAAERADLLQILFRASGW